MKASTSSDTQPQPSSLLEELGFLAKLSRQTPLGIVLRYALSVVVVAAAMGLRLMLEAWCGYGLPTYVTFYPAVMSVALLVGFGPGLLATVVAALAAMYWLMPIGLFAATSAIDRLGVVLFSGMGLFMCLVAELYRRNRDKVAAYDREAALGESEKRLALAASATKIGIFEWNITSGRVFWTHTHGAIFGYAPAAVATATATAEHDYHKLIDRIHPDDRQSFETELCRCILEGKTLKAEYRIIWPDGSLHWVETKGDPQHDSDGTVTRMLGVVMDITERKRAEEALREANEFLRLFIEHAPAALAMFDTNMRYLGASSRWRYDYCLGEGELVGKSHYEIFPEITEDWKETYRRALSGEVLRAEGERFERRDGSVQWVRWEIRPWHKSTGQIGGIVIFSEDITEIKQAEEILRRYELLARHSRDIILFIRREDGHLLEVNAAAINCYGYDHEELLEMKINELRVPESSELTAAQMAEADTSGILFETVHRRKDGSIFPVEVSSQGATINGTRTLISVVRDITERNRAEEALRENRERLELALTSSKMATFDWDILKGRRTWSDGVHSLLGTIPETFTGSAEEFFQIVHPEDRSTVQAALALAVKSTGLYMTEYRAVWPDGSIHHISARGKVQYDNSGRAVLMTGICWDITEHKQAEQKLLKANDELEARVTERTRELATALQTLQIESAERIRAVEALREREQMLIQQSRQAALGEMIGNIAHQWRQPLNILSLQTQQLLMMYDFGEITRESLNSNVSSSMELIQHMSRTIDDFRNYFRPDKGKTEFALSGVITNTLSLIEDSFRNERISIEIRANDDHVITGFRNEFAQVILNILNNARDVLIERKISDPRVTISLFAEGGRVVVSIADNAGGVPEEILGKIFDPYFTTKGPQTGTGVGLFMSKSIIEKNMAGMLTVRNTADGAEFRIEV